MSTMDKVLQLNTVELSISISKVENRLVNSVANVSENMTKEINDVYKNMTKLRKLMTYPKI